MPPTEFKNDLVAEIKNLRAFAISLSGSVSLADDLVPLVPEGAQF